MPTSSAARPWSTQYKDDYNPKSAGWHRKRSTKQRSTVCWARPFVPKATPIMTTYDPAQNPTVASYIPPTYGGRYYGMEDPYNLSDEDEDKMRIDPVENGVTFQDPMLERPMFVDECIGTEVEPVIPEPTEISREPHWICWPEPKTSSKNKRPHTSLGFYRENDSHQNCFTGNDQVPTKGAPLTYEPEIKSWTNATQENDFKYILGLVNNRPDAWNWVKVQEGIKKTYRRHIHLERKTVENMYSTLQRSQSFYEPTRKPMTSISVNEPPIRDTYSLYGQGRMSNSVDPTGVYRQSFFPYHKPGGHGAREEQVMQMLSNRMEGRQPNNYNYNYSFNKYPLHMRGRRFPVVSDDYVHEQSMFMTTTPRCVGHFIIHPDWVSEKSALRRSNTMVMPNRSKKEGFRY